MENLDDDEIQHIVEELLKNQQSSHGDFISNGNLELYTILFKELAKTDNPIQNSALAETVLSKIRNKQNRLEQFYYSLFIFAIFVLVAVITLWVVKLIYGSKFDAISKFFFDHMDTLIFISFIYTIIQVLDRYIKSRHKILPPIKM